MVTDITKLAIFTIEQKEYAITLSNVERVVHAAAITPLTEAPKIVLGLINFEGSIIPVINLRKCFKIEERDIHLSDQFIIAKTSERTVALWVDEVTKVLELTNEDLTLGKKILPNSLDIEGVVIREDGMILIYNLDRLLSLDINET
ncbi:MAG: chemotaxis protein CheW [Desulfobacterales bacterium]|nr:chemotaxis protein CheW [Desulfobacterales bacterium]